MFFRPSIQVIGKAMPPLSVRAGNLRREVAKAVAATARGTPLIVSQEEADRRLGICTNCITWFSPEAYGGIGGCSHPACGCCVRAKRWATALHCPIGRW